MAVAVPIRTPRLTQISVNMYVEYRNIFKSLDKEFDETVGNRYFYDKFKILDFWGNWRKNTFVFENESDAVLFLMKNNMYYEEFEEKT